MSTINQSVIYNNICLGQRDRFRPLEGNVAECWILRLRFRKLLEAKEHFHPNLWAADGLLGFMMLRGAHAPVCSLVTYFVAAVHSHESAS